MERDTFLHVPVPASELPLPSPHGPGSAALDELVPLPRGVCHFSLQLGRTAANNSAQAFVASAPSVPELIFDPRF